MDIDVVVERKSFDVELEVGNPVVEVKAPDHYNGPFDIFPSDEDQIIPVKEKMPVEDICVKGITGEKTITENGTYNTLEDKTVTVDIPATGYDKGTLIYEGDFATTTGTFSVTSTPDGQPFSFDKIEVDFSINGEGPNTGWRQYWRRDLPMTGNTAHMFNAGVGRRAGATMVKVKNVITVEDDTYIRLLSFGYAADNPIDAEATARRLAHDGYNKITAYGWWSWGCPAGTHIKIIGYNRIGESS